MTTRKTSATTASDFETRLKEISERVPNLWASVPAVNEATERRDRTTRGLTLLGHTLGLDPNHLRFEMVNCADALASGAIAPDAARARIAAAAALRLATDELGQLGTEILRSTSDEIDRLKQTCVDGALSHLNDCLRDLIALASEPAIALGAIRDAQTAIESGNAEQLTAWKQITQCANVHRDIRTQQVLLGRSRSVKAPRRTWTTSATTTVDHQGGAVLQNTNTSSGELDVLEIARHAPADLPAWSGSNAARCFAILCDPTVGAWVPTEEELAQALSAEKEDMPQRANAGEIELGTLARKNAPLSVHNTL